MIKKITVSTLLIMSFNQTTFSSETMSYNEVPVITSEFEVEQEDQKKYADLPKDTKEIQVESDFLGLKKFYQDTFDREAIKHRFQKGWKELKQPESSVVINNRNRE